MSVKQVITKLGGSGVVARALGLPEASGPASVRGWVKRDSIPPAMFNGLARLASERGLSEITVGALVDLAERRRAGDGDDGPAMVAA